MARIFSIASGKGGVGKSVVASNLGILLALRNYKVVLADLDVGGADIHVLFGEFNTPFTISDFLYRRVAELSEVIHPLPFKGLSMIQGTGDTLATANMNYARKKRLIDHLKKIEADIIIIDVGAGTSFHALDFFLMADHHITVATSDPTSVLDLYRLVKLATIRRVLSLFLANGQMAESLAHQDFTSVESVLDAVAEVSAEEREKVEKTVREFNPFLILNRVSGTIQTNTNKLQQTLKKFVGCDITMLGAIPEDAAIAPSVRGFLPVVADSPDSPAAKALSFIANNLLESIDMPSGTFDS